MRLSSKISLSVSLIVLAVLALGNWLIWDQLGAGPLRRLHLLLGLWTMGGVAFAVYFVVRHITRPLTELTDLAAQLGAGHLDRRFCSDADDEIGRLSRALDRMAASLLSSRDDLEREIAERTSQLQRSQAQLLQAAKLAAVGELAAGVAHEINNPAGTILMRLGQLAEALDSGGAPRGGGPQVADDLDVIRRQVEKIGRIVSGLVTFSRRSEQAGDMVPRDLNETVRRTAQLMDGFLRSRGVDVALDLAPGLPRVRADSARIEQVLLNLVNNAVDAMPRGGRLTFGSFLDQTGHCGQVAVYVEDTGTGIAAEHLGRVFDPFFTTKEPGEGTGLGLSVSYGIIEQHGGTIDVTSTPGQGSRFTMFLPACPRPAELEVVDAR